MNWKKYLTANHLVPAMVIGVLCLIAWGIIDTVQQSRHLRRQTQSRVRLARQKLANNPDAEKARQLRFFRGGVDPIMHCIHVNEKLNVYKCMNDEVKCYITTGGHGRAMECVFGWFAPNAAELGVQ